eukprot:TRINITY_DN2112_c0_g1_i1.p2 TRINITY_DN2112_c0_g1~~TRINITY_DN2112_c0_g1_i1.p2  ORF type:complete len:64 (-),score=5.24 TRINITY_DN2112_c0_g1_i1:14-205(-)
MLLREEGKVMGSTSVSYRLMQYKGIDDQDPTAPRMPNYIQRKVKVARKDCQCSGKCFFEGRSC